jgi:predicted Zn finger-like uncharacterized protein
MSLATRCPNCTTVFRVVQDQLRVSEGWVRCGRCSNVFNAAQNLVDPATGDVRRAPIEVHSGMAPPVPAPAPPPPPRARAAPPVAAAPALPRAGVGPPAPAERAGAADAPPDIRAEPEPASLIERAVQAPGPAPRAEPAAAGLPEALRIDAPPDAAAAGGARPSFVRQAERAERWRSPGVRALLLLAVLLATALLAGQALHFHRDRAAAHWPELRPLLESACAALGCRIEHARAIEALAVESSGLVRVNKSELYRLAVSLRNQQDFVIALPAIDLSLTDTQGRLIARRVVRPAELGVTVATVGARAELQMQGTIQVSAAPVAGYTIELFYP